MCGIVGFVSSVRRDGPAMVRALHHRGPDSSGVHESETHGKQVFLGHTRLSIIDLSEAGSQPMFNQDGRIAIVFNGEIYNFRELRSRYLRDRSFRSATDTEVLLGLYELLGLKCLDLLIGDFAIAILDGRRRKLVLVRDRIGVKPLYIWRRAGDLVFGSEIKSLLAGGVEPVLAQENLQSYFVFKYVPGTATLFRGVERLPPGCYLEYDLQTAAVEVVRYWQPDTATDGQLSYDDAQLRLRGALEDATRLRLVADVSVGNFLSGGLDSSIVASIVRDQPQISHYCAQQSAADVAQEGTTSDYAYASRLADEWQLKFKAIDIGAANTTLDQIGTTTFYGDDLIADSAQIPTYLITKGAAGSSRVFLSGMGADELLLGYSGHILALLDSYLGVIPGNSVIRSFLAGLAQGRGRFKNARRYLYRLGKYRAYTYRSGIYSLVGDYENSMALVEGDRERIEEILGSYFPRGGDPFEGFKAFEFDNFLQKNLAYTDRMSMANSVEVRVPFLDHRVVNLAYSLPRSYKLGPFGKGKRVLKAAYRGIVPDYVVNRRKAGFAMPIRSIFSSREAVASLLDRDLLAQATPISLAAVDGVVERHVLGLEDNSSIIYAVLSFQEWYRRFFT